MHRSQGTFPCKNTKLKFLAPVYLNGMIQLLGDKFALGFGGS